MTGSRDDYVSICGEGGKEGIKDVGKEGRTEGVGGKEKNESNG